MQSFAGRLAIQQRVLAAYRAPFFDALARDCAGGLSVCAGLPRQNESIATTDLLRAAEFTPLTNVHLFSGALTLCHQAGLLDWLAKVNAEILITDTNPRLVSTPAAIRWMHQRKRPVIGWGLGVAGGARRGWSGALRLFLRRYDALITYSRQGAEQYASFGFPAERIFVAPNAATPAPTHPLPLRPQKPDDRLSLLFVGRLQARKRLDVLLQACATLPEAIRPRLVIIGDGPERPALQALAGSFYPEAEFMGAKHGLELMPHFLAADLFVLPGTGGLAVQEAMSWGLPVIMGQGDGTNDELVRLGNGWQVPDPAQLAGVLREALSDVARLRRMGAESYRIVAEEINLENMVAVFLQALDSVKVGRDKIIQG
jgi:glycosyltransferase involved in cell wall biosynthesis